MSVSPSTSNLDSIEKGFDGKNGVENPAFTRSEKKRRDFHSSCRGSSFSKANDNITYTWKNITVWTGDPKKVAPQNNQKSGLDCFSKCRKKPVQPKRILNNVSGIVRPGELVAIMGASGAGKSSLLNVLTFRNTSNLHISGQRAVNGVPVGPNSLTAVSAYVQQDDLFIGSLTVREHLVFQAQVRMHKHIPYKDRIERVEEVISDLGLLKCSNTQIGIPGRIKGISGGEMKRLSFASEVLTDPPLLLIDEPTSGLDSFRAQTVVQVLKQMAERGKSILCTIHQPSSQVYSMFDTVLYMAEGRVAFMGPTNEAINFFNGNGFQCPVNFNPSDFFIQSLAILPGEEVICRENVSKLCDAFDISAYGQKIKDELNIVGQADSEYIKYLQAEEKEKFKTPYKASWFNQYKAVLKRSWNSNLKDPFFIKIKAIQTIALSLIIGTVYFGQKFNQDGVQNINGALFLLLMNLTFSYAFGVIDTFTGELPIFLREHFNGMYRTDVYFISKMVAEMPFYIFFPSVFIAVSYFMIGLNSDVQVFFISLGIYLLIANCAVSFGYLVSCIAPNITTALGLAPAVIVPLLLFGGLFVNTGSVPVWLSWIRFISWFYYGNEAIVITQWRDVKTIECNRENSTCPANGLVVLKTLDFNEDNFTFDIIALSVLTIVLRLLAFLSLLAKTFRNKS